MGVKGCCTQFVQPDGGRSALGEAVAHAPPARRGARSTPRGYAPLESSGNGCLRQPMQTFFYCDSHESQQRGKTPRVKVLVNNFKKHFQSIFSPFQSIWATLVFPIFWPNFCLAPEIVIMTLQTFWAQKSSIWDDFWPQKSSKNDDFWAQKTSLWLCRFLAPEIIILGWFLAPEIFIMT